MFPTLNFSPVHGMVLQALGFPTVGLGTALLVGAATLELLTGRCLFARFFRKPKGVSILVGIERAVTRLLMLTALLLAMAALWWLAVEFKSCAFHVGTGAATSTALFLWVRKWLSEPPQETHGGNLLRMALGWLKRASAKILATITWLLLFILVGMGVAWWLQHEGTADGSKFWFWLLPGGSAFVVIIILLVFDLERMGMHELYRSRICRCYLGASNQDGCQDLSSAKSAAMNRSTGERLHDDLTLGDLAKVTRPMLLVCAAANDISDDPIGTLYRGAKNAVLSGNGISLGDNTAKLDTLRLSSALTASAAAFNSQMGRISMDLGPAVTFLMSAFNLRLGLWVPNPENTKRWRINLPGYFFFRELFGLSTTKGKHLLLSDGNHFENFGLYELIRRHCRYIIVSDCGADPQVAFDDLANVLRRLREDFGVEIELDVTRLNPGPNGLACQHAVVGTIHYNGWGGMDKGTILFIKPSITGDEPPDVLQYQTRNKIFPQESTINQFYDEPQWESYRRLGEHIGRTTLAFLDRAGSKSSTTVDHIFRDARSYWHPMPENLNDRFVEMTARCAELEEDLTSEGPTLLRTEFFSEAAELGGLTAAKGGNAPIASQDPGVDDEIKILGFLIRIIQIMEDVWVSGDFEHYWSHPLNEGWMNYFHRWAGTPSFRRWWPVVSPIYSVGFRSFIKDRFDVGTLDSETVQPGTAAGNSAKLSFWQLDEYKPFSITDVSNFLMLIIELRDQYDPVSGFLWNRLSEQEQLMLRNYAAPGSDLKHTRTFVLEFLNKIIEGEPIYDRHRFQDVSMRPETSDLLGKNPEGPYLALLNRLLLEDAYPLELRINGKEFQKSQAWRCFLRKHPEAGLIIPNRRIFGYALQLLNRQGKVDDARLWVGFVLISESGGHLEKIAEWRAGDFFVPPMLHGGKFVSSFLDAIIYHYKQRTNGTFVKLQVNFSGQKSQGLDPADRYNRVREIEFYKSRGFQYLHPEDPISGAITLHLPCK